MVLALETRQKTLEELGGEIGVPIKVRPWWGSARERPRLVHKKCGESVDRPWGWGSPFCFKCSEHLEDKDTERRYVFGRRWPCPGGFYHNQIKWPEVRNGVVIVWEGSCRRCPGRGSTPVHTHKQTVEVLDVDSQIILVSVRVSGAWSNFLIGMDDGHPFVRPVRRRETTVQDALDWLVPNKVKESFTLGLDVKRQGDWYFIPVQHAPKLNGGYGPHVPLSAPALRGGALYRGVALAYGEQTRHTGGLVVYQSVLGLPYPAPFVRGVVKAPDHPPLRLNDWHMAIRQRRATWGRREHGGAVD